jgi:hypothetical protein
MKSPAGSAPSAAREPLSRAVLILACLFLCSFPASALRAQKPPLEDLCRLHGMEKEENVATIRKAYAAALSSGIPEEELFPFLEEILRHKLDCSQMVRVLSVTTRLRGEGLPYFVVFSKVREGVAKAAAPILVVEAAEAKLKSLTASREVLRSLEASGYRIRDFQNAAVIVSSYIEKGYGTEEIASQVRMKGIGGSVFTGLAGVLEKPARRKER